MFIYIVVVVVFLLLFFFVFFPKVHVKVGDSFSLRIKILADMQFNTLNGMDRLWYEINATVTPFFLKNEHRYNQLIIYDKQ